MGKENGEKISQLLDSILQEYQSGNLPLENQNYTYNQLTEMIRLLRKRIKFYSAQKNKFQNENDSEKLDNVRGILRDYKHIQSQLINLKYQKQIEIFPQSQNKAKEAKKEISIWEYLTQVALVDVSNHDSLEVLFEAYENEKDTIKKLDILYKIKDSVEDSIKSIHKKEEELMASSIKKFHENYKKNNIRTNDRKVARKCIQEDQNLKDTLESLQFEQRKMVLILERVHNLIRKEKNICAKKEKEDTRVVEFSTNRNVLQKLDLSKKDSLYQVLSYIQSMNIAKPEDIHNAYVQSETLFNWLNSIEEDLFISFNIIDRYIKTRLIQLENSSISIEDKEKSKKELKQLQKLYQNKKNHWFGKQKKIKDQKDYNYCSDILCTLMNNEQNYYYIKRIITENKCILLDTSVQNIVFPYTLDCFIKNSKLKIASHGLPYIDPEYYLKLLLLFLQNCNNLQDDVKKFLRSHLNSLHLSITGKKEIDEEELIDIDNMNLSNMKKETLKDIKSIKMQLDEENVKNQLQEQEIGKKLQGILFDYIAFFRKKISKECPNTNLPASFTFHNQLAYTITYNDEGDMLFKVHVLNTSLAFNEHMNIDEYMKQLEIEGKHVKVQHPFMDKGMYPVFTFHFRIYKNNTVGEMKIYQETIRIDNQYTEEQMLSYRLYPDLKNYVSAMKRMVSSELDVESIEQWIQKIISDYIIDILKKQEIPFIYQRPIVLNIQKLQEKNHNDICDLLLEIDKPIAHNIFNILDESPEVAYTNYPIDEAKVNLDGFTYTGLLLQRVLSHIDNPYDNNIGTEKDMLMLCKELNERFGYVSNTFFKEEKKLKDDKKYTKNKN